MNGKNKALLSDSKLSTRIQYYRLIYPKISLGTEKNIKKLEALYIFNGAGRYNISADTRRTEIEKRYRKPAYLGSAVSEEIIGKASGKFTAHSDSCGGTPAFPLPGT